MSEDVNGEQVELSSHAADIEAAIERCVRLFYAKAHADPLLGPVMTAAIADFERHVATIRDFWSRALLGSERYQGRAYPAHVSLPIRPEHFGRWLDLFAEAARSELPGRQAAVAIDKAQHMAKSFMAGLFPLETPRMQAHRARLVYEWPEAQATATSSRGKMMRAGGTVRRAPGADSRPLLIAGAAAVAVFLAGTLSHRGDAANPPPPTAEALGRELFFDVNLSRNRTQACASCHSPNLAFTDPRTNEGVGAAVSLGDDGKSLGERNTPTATYASLAPKFHIDKEGEPVGGLFLDGRAKDLEEQAGGPPLNPVEMAMPDKASVVARLKENPSYVTAFAALYGSGVLDDADNGYAAMTKAITAFERSPEFSPFDSRYDRYLRGEVKLTKQEELGRVLFFSNQFSNCSQCHRLDTVGASEKEPFTNFEYDNIGVPANQAIHAANGKPADRGLSANPAFKGTPHEAAMAGKFKVPTLRNVAVTAPYMHNGVFNDLRTVILFYDKYNSKAARRQVNPETGKPWDPPEVPENISLKELRIGPGLDDKRVDALVAFLKTLTDKRYEPLLKQ